jgi:molecular chaperone DnaK (HSP70)
VIPTIFLVLAAQIAGFAQARLLNQSTAVATAYLDQLVGWERRNGHLFVVLSVGAQSIEVTAFLIYN